MATNKEIVFESNRGIVFERTVYKNGNARLAVINKNNNKTMSEYRYKNAPGLQSPYLNWENLNCVNGWVYDKTYLHTAVQKGKKLYAGFTLSIAKKEVFAGKPLPQGFYTEEGVSEKVEALKKDLPGDCVLGSEGPDYDTPQSIVRYYYICKTGTIRDYIDIDDVISAYGRFGMILNESHWNKVRELCSIPISGFSSNDHMDYANTKSVAEYIVAGLLLGYPIESTVDRLS